MFGIIKIFHVFEKKPFQKYQKYNKKSNYYNNNKQTI